MIDQLEALFEEIDLQGEEEDVTLTLLSVTLPRQGGVWVDGDHQSSVESEHEVDSLQGTTLANLWWERQQMAESTVGGRGVDTAVGGGGTVAETVRGRAGRRATSLLGQMTQQGRAAQVAEGLERSGVAVSTSPFWDRKRDAIGTTTTARTLDRTMERDARRYDGGFLLG